MSGKEKLKHVKLLMSEKLHVMVKLEAVKTGETIPNCVVTILEKYFK